MKRLLLALGLLTSSMSFAETLQIPMFVSLQEGVMEYGSCVNPDKKEPINVVKDLDFDMIDSDDVSVGNSAFMMQTPGQSTLMFMVVHSVNRANPSESSQTVGVYHDTAIVSISRISGQNPSSTMSNGFIVSLENNVCYNVLFSLNSKASPSF